MAVESLNNTLQRISTEGEPELWRGQAEVAGDGTGGVSTISFDFPAGPNWVVIDFACSGQSASALANTHRCTVVNLIPGLAAGVLDWGNIVNVAAAQLSSFYVQVPMPKTLFRTIASSTIDVVAANLGVGPTHHAFIGLLLWRGPIPPPTALINWTLPPTI